MCINCGPTYGCVKGCLTNPEGRDATEEEKRAYTERRDPEEINHPDHYGGDTPYEVIKVLRAWDLELAKGFCWGNLIKYTARAGQKGSALQDREKANWYATELVSIEAELATRSKKGPSEIPIVFPHSGDYALKINWEERTYKVIYRSGGSGG